MFTTYDELDMIGKIVWNLRNIGHCLRHTSGGKGGQKRILTVLLKSGCVTQTALTEHLGIQPGSASEVLSKMESAGFLRRWENENDHRTVNVALTQEGEQEAIRAEEERNQTRKKMFSALSKEEQTELLFLLEKVTADWGDFDCCRRKKEGSE